MLPAVLLVPLELRGTVPLAVTQAPWALFILLKCCSQEAGLCLRRLLFHVKSPGSSLNIDSCYCRNLGHDTDFFFHPCFGGSLGNPLGKHLSHPCPWVLGSGSGACLQATEMNISWLDTQKAFAGRVLGSTQIDEELKTPASQGLLHRTRGAAVNGWPLPGTAVAGHWGSGLGLSW